MQRIDLVFMCGSNRPSTTPPPGKGGDITFDIFEDSDIPGGKSTVSSDIPACWAKIKCDIVISLVVMSPHQPWGRETFELSEVCIRTLISTRNVQKEQNDGLRSTN